MYTLLENRDALARAQQDLQDTIRAGFKSTPTRTIGHAARTLETTVYTDGAYWFCSPILKPNRVIKQEYTDRRFHWFGRYTEKGTLQIAVEINTPLEGTNPRLSCFARDETGSVCLMHSGNIGGRSTGLREKFLDWINETLIKVIDSGRRERDVIFVMPVQGEGATLALARYVEKVARFKESISARPIPHHVVGLTR